MKRFKLVTTQINYKLVNIFLHYHESNSLIYVCHLNKKNDIICSGCKDKVPECQIVLSKLSKYPLYHDKD